MKRVAVVDGARTPFAKAGTTLSNHSALDLSVELIKKFLARSSLSPDRYDEFSFSSVLLDPRTPNLAREIVFRTDLPQSLPAHFVSNNCISGLVSVNGIREGILSGRISSGLAGGVESMSRPTLTLKRKAEDFYLKLARSRGLGQSLGVASAFRPSFIFPVPPSPKEPSTGLTMGEHCELMAKEFGIERKEQDELALRSHLSAARAEEEGNFSGERLEIAGVKADNLVRPGTTLEKLGSLKAVFDRSESGTLTAGNSSALTDGASVVALMEEERASRESLEVLGFIDDVVFTAVDPAEGLLMAPGLAVPKLLERNGLSIDDIDRFEIHEAFAAQVLANRKVWREGWNRYPELKSIGEMPEEKVNVNGGSLAIGHPFAATGGRLILSAVHELKRGGLRRAVLSVCAAGAMAAAVLISRDES